MSIPAELTPRPGSEWVKVRLMDDVKLPWNDVKFFPFGHLSPLLDDMKGVAAVCGGNTIKVIKLDPIEDTCRLLYDIIDKSNAVTGDREENFNSISWSIDPVTLQPILAGGGVRAVIKLFDARTATEIGMIYGHGGTISALAFSPTDPHILASASIDHTVRIWNTTSSLKASHTRPGSELQSLLPNWDNPPGQLVTILAGEGGHTAPVCSIAWHPKHPLLATGGMDNHVKVWQLSRLPGLPVDSLLDDMSVPEELQPGFQVDSPVDDINAPESLHSDDEEDPATFPAAPITSLPLFNSKHLHTHWVDQIIWASRLSPILISKSGIISKGGHHPFAAYASEEDLEPASRICIWQPSILGDAFLGKNLSSITTQENEANIGGVDFDIFSAFKVRRPSLNAEQESVEWGLGMCLTQTHRFEGGQLDDLAILFGNHPRGIAELPLSSLENSPDSSTPTVILHSSTKSKSQQEETESHQEIFRAIDSTSISPGSDPTFLLRVGQNGSIELWKRNLSVPRNR
ncbi:hypothetical protein KEM48_004880 [Puccinia striiformis f. sp. tritici PST-130]|uniref:Uncharacterized protein n=2 Tax=Puccinia striiformis TaxID=27350 RepID=A0A0L0VJJ0_9BASI|nr:hypothetical protein Pst134EB_008132 [Puccinia striiformis f. sp. tritici]KAI9617427.1 hypothetical protein KEM48_004880 [Puccinia striiformis f. sp. tritici PST-130]KNE99381.1 hypothetical protein PSTG_07313 [Puccinia striiformis f. sp. tritici PST-78]POW07294.1 hypothetical protein PSTT_08352 [Puccinia striiformis]